MIALATLLWLLYVYLEFRRTTKRWRNQDARQSISASWKWTTLVLQSFGFSFSSSTPLENIAHDKSVESWPEEMRAAMIQLASICSDAAYKQEEPTVESRNQAWNIANSLKQEATRNAKWRRRVAFRFRRVLP
jgi:hypothetical protein